MTGPLTSAIASTAAALAAVHPSALAMSLIVISPVIRHAPSKTNIGGVGRQTQHEREAGDEVVHIEHRISTIAYEHVAAPRSSSLNVPRHRQHRATLLERSGRRDESTPFNAGFHDDCHPGQTADNSIAGQ